MSAWLKPLGQVRDMTGYKFRLGLEESVHNIIIKDTTIYVILNRARVKQSKNSYTVTHRGIQTIRFNYHPSNGWERDEVTCWHPLHAPERVAARTGPTPAEHRDRTAWEALCYRPGNDAWPIDSPARRAQGY